MFPPIVTLVLLFIPKPDMTRCDTEPHVNINVEGVASVPPRKPNAPTPITNSILECKGFCNS